MIYYWESDGLWVFDINTRELLFRLSYDQVDKEWAFVTAKMIGKRLRCTP